MVEVYSFHGGIHPPQNKTRSTQTTIKKASLPERLVIPVSQHLGAPAEPLVKVGDRVLKGQLIAEPIGHISASIHAPSSGVISAISLAPIAHSSGLEGKCIEITTDGKEEWVELKPFDYQTHTLAELLNYVRQSGIAGMGGAGFPTHVKLGHQSNINTLIINAAECEPYITADDMLMRERTDQVLSGIEILVHLINPERVLFGIEDNKPEAISLLEQAISDSELDIQLCVVPTKYPSGGEKQLIKLLTNEEVPSGKLPADLGILCQNVGTTVALHRAVNLGEPLISRIVTLTGDALSQNHNLEVLLGTLYKDLLDASGVDRQNIYRLVMGGAMMGFSMKNDAVPVVKTTNCIIAATKEEMPPAPPALNCIRCGFCEQVCPVELLPQQLHWFSKSKEYDKAKQHNLFDCIECGACSYVCPSDIPLVQYYRHAKADIRAGQQEKVKADHAKLRFEARLARLEQEKQEREAKRKERTELNKKVKEDKEKAQSKETGSTVSSSTNDNDLKKLKTAAALARAQLKKTEKALKMAQDKKLDNVADLESSVAELKEKSATAEANLAAAESAETKQEQPAVDETKSEAKVAKKPAAADDLKSLKTAAIIDRTKVKKAEKALAKAEVEAGDNIVELKHQLQQVQTQAEQSQAKFEQQNANQDG